MNVLYTAEATSTGEGRLGQVASSDGQLDLAVAPPKELGGTGAGTNPEQLFAAGYAACFHSALRRVAKAAGADITDSEVTAKVGLGRITPTSYGLTVELAISLPAAGPEAAQQAIEAAHAVCPYSNATRGNIEVTLTVVKTA
jgi:lipoyl-dependent peroxiredoxin